MGIGAWSLSENIDVRGYIFRYTDRLPIIYIIIHIMTTGTLYLYHINYSVWHYMDNLPYSKFPMVAQ
jgi:hypothetical protein